MKQKSVQNLKPQVEWLEDRAVPAGVMAVGAGVGDAPRVQVFDAETREVLHDFLAFSPRHRGGVNVAVGDVNGDGVPDIIAAAGPGNTPLVRVFDGVTGDPFDGVLGGFFAYSASFRGGVQVAAGDVNGDGKADIVTGVGKNGPPRVKAFSGADGSLLADFLAFSPDFRGGVRVSTGDFRHRLATDIIVAAGPGAAPRVKIFAGDTQEELASYLAYSASFRGGVWVGAGDINRDGTIDVVVGAGAGGGPVVKVFAGMSDEVVHEFLAFPQAHRGGVRVDAVDADGDTFMDILAAPQSRSRAQVRAFDGTTLELLHGTAAFNPAWGSGASVAGSVTQGKGTNFAGQNPVTVDIPLLERLARYVPISQQLPKGQYEAVTAGGIEPGKNVYVIAHGWAPGYRDWVNACLQQGHVLKWWETAGFGDATCPPPDPNTGPASFWMFEGYSKSGVTISPTGGLAQAIIDADPNAVVLAYSWIDDSATTSILDNAIPEQAYLSEALTNVNGLRLAMALRQLLGGSYTGQLHLLGHSHGSKVATLAALNLEQGTGIRARQLTILDSPESALPDEGNATNYNWYFLNQLPVAKNGGGLFVDNYFSAFGIAYAPMTIDGQTPLGQTVDVQTYAYPYSFLVDLDLGEWHSYPPAWYGQASVHPCTEQGAINGALNWSPLLGHDTSQLASQYQQEWSIFNYSTANQACLEAGDPKLYSVQFAALSIQNADDNAMPAVTSIDLGLGQGETRTFGGTYSKNTGWSGISFDYTFTGSERGLLTIQINDYLAYYIDSALVPAGTTQKVTMNFGWPSIAQHITISLQPQPGVNSTDSRVTLENFRQFKVSS